MKSRKPKPVAAQAETPSPEGRGVSRRGLFKFLWGAFGLAALAEMAWVALAFLGPGRHGAGDQAASAVVSAGAVESFPPGTVAAFQRGQFYLVRLDDGGFLALSCKCTHLGCTVPWVEKEKKFLCPCHASAFDITGSVTAAPAPRALDIFAVTIENHIVKVDTGRRVKRSSFNSAQLVYPPES
ncbi:MAG: Rieske 2Fe-2S domain-containing protein [Deltaproteobacteria bacterium]|nr:Rieske 2Fe-2S domain-containing protein [Deltaproteobacteria bacterium]